jgi:hypothetical protein
MSLHIRDARGRRISLLNDDDEPVTKHLCPRIATASYPPPPPPPRTASTPNTPELFRSNSYDSHMGTEPISPMTPLEPALRYPVFLAERRASFDDYYAEAMPMYAGTKRRPSTLSDGRSVSYEDDLLTTTSERPVKRYPCRYRDTHGCDKTFTTSGHASRHSKIHTAEKAVPCSFKGCPKKFTRADNMKQHLETHYKDKSRSSSSRPSLPLSQRRSSYSVKASGRSKLAAAAVAAARKEQVPLPSLPSPVRSAYAEARRESVPLPSPVSGAFNLGDLEVHPFSRPSSVRTPSSGLETLAMAAQELTKTSRS